MNMNEKKFNLLDCTLRDGGYYNNWNFSKLIIQSYINNIYSTGIRYVELGFRFYEENTKKGLTAYTDKNLIKNLHIPKDLKIGIMVNVGDLIQNNKFKIKILKRLINEKNINKIVFVRLACHHHEVFYLKECFEYLRKLKLKIFVNIMQISEINDIKLKKILLFLKKNKIFIIYIADSLGCLKPRQLKKIISCLKKNWHGQMGLHAHNNLKLALQNSILAIKNDFKWIDSTITGMGRGPGNLKTEEILRHTNSYKITKEFTKIKLYFNKLKKIYKWGPNKYYKFAAQKKIHPTYLQKILTDKRYSPLEYNEILSSLAKSNTKKYNPYKLVNSINFISTKINGKWCPKNLLKDKDILILGPGKNLKKNVRRIEKEIIKNNLFVISLNTFSSINEKYINLRAICHPFRITSDKIKLRKFKCKFVIPISSFSKNFRKSINLKSISCYDYGILIKPDLQVSAKNKHCILPNPLAIGYAFSLVISGKAKSLRLAGFDGYEKSDPDYDNTEELLKIFVNKYFKNKIQSLTKTKFKLLNFKSNK